mmetsp:Transcript_27029/g.77748  ORF Transcript_27029/g.77748 Transcript_27029/m.77748 type:complete len:538 (-) Transcript_27029:60-1673(-)
MSSEQTEKRQAQPLLSNETPGGSGPLLGGASEIDQSPLERLIMQSTSEQAAAAAAAASSTPFDIQDPESAIASQEENAGPSPATLHRATIVTLIAGTLCLLTVALVWASFVSSEWFETHLTVTIGRGTRFEYSTDQTLQATNLASFLSMLLGADQQWAATVLVLTCLICPCLSMILCPSWTVDDYQAVKTGRVSRIDSGTQLPESLPRVLAENFLVRIGLLAFFVLAIMDIGTSSLALENNNTDFLVTNRTRGGMVCYTVGVACALAVVVVLRVAAQQPFDEPNPAEPAPDDSASQPRAPPDYAFQELRRPLLVDEEEFRRATIRETSSRRPAGAVTNERKLPGWKRIIVYEAGVLAVALWLPILFLPLLNITFDGLVAKFMEGGSLELYFFQLPIALHVRGLAAGTDPWMLLALGVVLLCLVYIFPLMATSVAVGAWRSRDHSKAVWFYKAILVCLQPCLCGSIFAFSLLMGIPALEPLGEYLLDSQTSGFCQSFEDVTSTSCLDIEGNYGLGLWFLLAQSISLEIFVMLTILWKK